MDPRTRREIDKTVEATLRKAGLTIPPISIEDLLEHLRVDREYYDLKDPNLLERFWHKVRVGKEKLISIIHRIKLDAVWLPDEKKIIVDGSLPDRKKEWASFHDGTHRLLPWHRQFFLGDTAQTLDPDFQEMLENEANYGASALMFGGRIFTTEAVDTSPNWASVEALQRRYKKSLVTTLRRYVQFGLDCPMAMMVSTPWWKVKPPEQEFRWRHYICSERYKREFSHIDPEYILKKIDSNTIKRRGGIVGDFYFELDDSNKGLHEFRAESFFNQHDLLTLIVHQKKMN